jgi:hypothetical protein
MIVEPYRAESSFGSFKSFPLPAKRLHAEAVSRGMEYSGLALVASCESKERCIRKDGEILNAVHFKWCLRRNIAGSFYKAKVTSLASGTPGKTQYALVVQQEAAVQGKEMSWVHRRVRRNLALVPANTACNGSKGLHKRSQWRKGRPSCG